VNHAYNHAYKSCRYAKNWTELLTLFVTIIIMFLMNFNAVEAVVLFYVVTVSEAELSAYCRAAELLSAFYQDCLTQRITNMDIYNVCNNAESTYQSFLLRRSGTK